MRIALNILAAIVSIVAMVLYIQADKTGIAAIWGMTSGIWIANVITSIMER